MDTKTTTTEQHTVNTEVISKNTVFTNPAIKSGVFSALAILGAITILYIGAYVAISGVKHTPEIGKKITDGVHNVRVFLASVFVFSDKKTATSTPAIIATTTTTTATTTTTTPTVTNPTPVRPTYPTRPYPVTPGTATTHVYPGYGSNGNGVVSNPNGKPDLAVTLVSYGTLDKTTNVYTATTTPVNRGSRIAVRFNVTNIGDKTSPTWRFNGYLPIYPNPIFNSDEQAAINPGEKVEFTIGFDQMQDTATGTVKIEVDPSFSINESNESNNIMSVDIPIQR